MDRFFLKNLPGESLYFRKFSCAAAYFPLLRHLLGRRCGNYRTGNGTVQHRFHRIATVRGMAHRHAGTIRDIGTGTYRHDTHPDGLFRIGRATAVILRTAHGVFHAASSNASSTWVTDIIPHKRMGEGLGMYGLSMAISTAVAPALGLAVMNAWGFRPLFAIAALTALAALLTGMGIRSRNYAVSDAPLRIRELFEPMSLPAAVTQFFFMMAYGVVEVYVAIYATSCRLPGGGIYFIFIALATVATRILLGRAVDRYGEARLVYTGNAAIVIGILLLVFAHNVPCYLLSALLLGYSFGAIQPLLTDDGDARRSTRTARGGKLHVFRGFRLRYCVGRLPGRRTGEATGL